MIDTLLNLMFRCPHRRLTRPMAPVTKAGKPHSQTYVVCLDCGKQFEYDVETMQMGRPIEHSHEAAVAPPKPPARHRKKIAFGVLAALPAAVLLRAAWKSGKKEPPPRDRG